MQSQCGIPMHSAGAVESSGSEAGGRDCAPITSCPPVGTQRQRGAQHTADRRLRAGLEGDPHIQPWLQAAGGSRLAHLHTQVGLFHSHPPVGADLQTGRGREGSVSPLGVCKPGLCASSRCCKEQGIAALWSSQHREVARLTVGPCMPACLGAWEDHTASWDGQGGPLLQAAAIDRHCRADKTMGQAAQWDASWVEAGRRAHLL